MFLKSDEENAPLPVQPTVPFRGKSHANGSSAASFQFPTTILSNRIMNNSGLYHERYAPQALKPQHEEYDVPKGNTRNESRILRHKLASMYHPEERFVLHSVLFLLASLVSLAMFFLEYHSETTFAFSVLFFMLATYRFGVTYAKKRNLEKLLSQCEETEEPLAVPTIEHYSEFLEDHFEDVKMTDEASIVNGQFVNADRATASFGKIERIADVNIDQRALKALQDLSIPYTHFKQYLSNMKVFISQTLMKKLSTQLHSDDPMIETMLSVPKYEHCREYTMQRVKELANSLSHYGNKGTKWEEREWSSELPSDNQIVLHILGTWLSFFMCGKKIGKRPKLVFQQKFFSYHREPSSDDGKPVVIFTNDWSDFSVITSFKSSPIIKYQAFSGLDSLYSALTIFFWIINEKYHYLLDGADLTDVPICIDRVYKFGKLK